MPYGSPIYQVTIERPNGDWIWRNWQIPFHQAAEWGLSFANANNARLVSIVRINSDRILKVELDMPWESAQ